MGDELEIEGTVVENDQQEDPRTMEELTAELEAMHVANYGFGYKFNDTGTELFYTGKAGRGFMSNDPVQTFMKYSKEGAMRKALEFYNRYSTGILNGDVNILIVAA